MQSLKRLFAAAALGICLSSTPAIAHDQQPVTVPQEIDFNSVCEEPPIPETKAQLIEHYKAAQRNGQGIDRLDILETPVAEPDAPEGEEARYTLLKITAGDQNSTDILYVVYDSKKEDTNKYYPRGLWISPAKSVSEKFCYTTEKAYNQILAGQTPDPIDKAKLPPFEAPPQFFM